jgi:hypothetical protein
MTFVFSKWAKPAVAICVAVMVAVAGCGKARPTTSGPLTGPSDDYSGKICVPLSLGGAATLGAMVLSNGGETRVVVDDVIATDPKGVILASSELVPLAPRAPALGAARTYPPQTEFTDNPGVGWKDRRPAAGATIEPHQAQVEDLVVAVRLTSPSGGSASGFEVYYHTADQRYVLKSKIGVRVVIAPACS